MTTIRPTLHFWITYILFHLTCTSLAIKTSVPNDVQAIVNSPSYDRHATPSYDDGGATEVKIFMFVEGMSSIRAETMDFSVDIYFEQRWEDLRLRHNSTHRILIKDPEILKKLWLPDLYFANANDARAYEVTAPNFLLWVFNNGTVHYDCRFSLSLICNMDLAYYPLDAQECDIRILSYAYTLEQVLIFWKYPNESITMNNAIRLPDMRITEIRQEYCDGIYSMGVWGCLRSVFAMQREIMHHILQSYIPTVLIVVISWFSFWLDIDAVPGRVSLCITTLLTLATQASSARLSLPQVSYAKAIDVWMEACLGFVFGVLIEFTAVNFLARRDMIDEDNPVDRVKDTRDQEMKSALSAMLMLNTAFQTQRRRKRKRRETAIRVDRFCRVLFPVAFLVFNIAYWSVYLTPQNK